VRLIYARHCKPISIKIGQHSLKLCTKLFWCVFYTPQHSKKQTLIFTTTQSFHYAPQLVPAGTAEARISYGNSVRLSVRLSRPGGIPSPGEIETPGLHHMVAWSI